MPEPTVPELTGDATTSGLDLARLRELYDVDPGPDGYLERAIGNFARNSSAAVLAITEACTAGDVEAVRSTAHKIAGSALNLGATDAGQVARAVELLAVHGSLEVVTSVLPHLEATMREARTRLLACRDGLATAGRPPQ